MDLVARALEVAPPLVVLGELRAGFSLGRHGVENERILGRFLQRPCVHVLSPDETTTHHDAAVYRLLRKHGTPIPTDDTWIAAIVLRHGLVLHARDRRFDALPQPPRA